jgi:predicted Zn-dependent protease with MMP-like domain
MAQTWPSAYTVRMNDSTHQFAPSLAEIEALAQDALQRLPEAYAPAAAQVVLRIEDFAPEELVAELEVGDAFELTGVYDGIPLTEKAESEQALRPDVIWLFRRPILDEWADRGDVTLGALVTHVLIHELAHHFGWSDADIAAIDPWWE